MIIIKNYKGEPYLEIDKQIMERDKVKLFTYKIEIIFEVIANEVVSGITSMPFNKIQLANEYKKSVTIEIPTELDITGLKQRIFFIFSPDDKTFEILIDFSWETEKWKNIFSTEELRNEANGVAKRMGITIESDIDGYSLKFICNNNSNNCLEEYLRIANNVTREAINQLIIKNREGTLTSIFEFPEHIRVPCEQYLIYFSEFLKNIGIKATTEITHQANNVLFTVVPESTDEALNIIQEALEIYLQLPSIVNDIGYTNFPSDLQVQQLMANVQHFKSQIIFLNATVQLQAQTIEQLQTLVEQQQRVIDSTILQASLVTKALSEEEDKEEILGGAVALTKLEGKGFEVNIANVYRWLKNRVEKN
ncbi:hypothetical protein ACQP3R_00980 [Bacillus inaquosorum]|uniref:hypothetical protein n=1 Tax=Bacillus inaquosorum TaxID=483913 RepID=UPI003D00E154